MLSRRDIEPMNQSPLAGKDGKGYVMSEGAIAAGEAWLVEQTRRERIREAIKAVDRAVLAGVGDWEEAVQETGKNREECRCHRHRRLPGPSGRAGKTGR